jgi:zinc-finger of a C2HC-type
MVLFITSGQQFGTHSIEIHLKSCKKKWEDNESKKPANERRPLPIPSENIENVVKNSKQLTQKEIVKANEVSLKSYTDQSMMQCEFCGRKFTEKSLQSHAKSCTREHPHKRVGEPSKTSTNFFKGR